MMKNSVVRGIDDGLWYAILAGVVILIVAITWQSLFCARHSDTDTVSDDASSVSSSDSDHSGFKITQV